MFYYYGGKRRLAGAYSAPEHNVIVEPFAGSAGYAVRHLVAERSSHVERVILVEKDARVCEIWERLLRMSSNELNQLVVPKAGERIDDFLWMTSACSNRIARTKSMLVTERMPVVIERMLRQIAVALPHMKGRVEIINGDYTEAPDIEATWFIDPPYQVAGRAQARGMGYAPDCDSSSLDYDDLAAWCRSRRGQVIVCEQSGASWLPFVPLRAARDSIGKFRDEVVWTRELERDQRPVSAETARGRSRPQVVPSPLPA